MLLLKVSYVKDISESFEVPGVYGWGNVANGLGNLNFRSGLHVERITPNQFNRFW